MSAERSAEPAEGTPVDDEISGARVTPVDPLIGMRVAERYRILRVHDRGGMSVVYAATYEAQQREVAIKVLDEASSSDPLAIERFMHEARTASSLSHGHVVGVSDFGRLPNGRPYLVMPMIPGKDLATLIAEEGPMPATRAAALLAGVASALDAMHAQGLIHRDIKSENLMYVRGDDGTETALVLDFGIAAAPQSKELEDDATSGTPDFMAPEALAGEPMDQRADVYSLATVAFELLSGGLPFESADVAELAKIKTTTRPRTLWQVAHKQFSPAIETVIARGLARDPKNRPSSAGKLVHALSVAASSASTTLQAPWVKALAARAAAVAATSKAAAPPPAKLVKKTAAKPVEKAAETPRQVRKRTLVGPFTPQVGEIEPVVKTAAPAAREPAPPTLRELAPMTEREAEAVRAVVAAITDKESASEAPAAPQPAPQPAPSVEPSIVVDPALYAELAQQRSAQRVLPPIDSMSPVSELEVDPTFTQSRPWPRFGVAAAALLGVVAVIVIIRAQNAESEQTQRLSTSAAPSDERTPERMFAPAAAPEPTPAPEPVPAPAPAVSAPAPALEVVPEAAPAPAPAPVVEATPAPEPEPAPIAKPASPAPSTKSRSRAERPSRSEARTERARAPVAREPTAPRASAQELTQGAVDAMLRGDFNAALAQFKAATAENPRYAPAHRGRGLVLERMGRGQEAATAFKQYLRYAPSAPDAAKIKARLAALE